MHTHFVLKLIIDLLEGLKIDHNLMKNVNQKKDAIFIFSIVY